jgi:uncharacterized membrane protein
MKTDSTPVVRYAWILGVVILGVVALVDLTVDHHAHFERDGIVIDTLPEFFPVYGFLSAFVFVLIAKTLAIALKRKDTYYADD